MPWEQGKIFLMEARVLKGKKRADEMIYLREKVK